MAQFKSTPSRNADQLADGIFKDTPGSEIKFAEVAPGASVLGTADRLSKPIRGSYATAATQRIGTPSDRQESSTGKSEDSDVGSSVMKVVRMLGDGETIHDFDATRQGKNVVNMTHFSRMNYPLVTINREGFDYGSNQLNHVAAFNLYGMPKLFRSYDESKRKAIPFEDFPGRLNPVDYIAAGDYVLQYMILTDLTRNVDKFVNPDTLDGVIEVFEVRESFANTSISDIRIKGIKGSMPNESFYAVGQGASPIENKFEIDQLANSFFEDSQDILFGQENFGPRVRYDSIGPFSLENFVADERRLSAPFKETTENRDTKIQTRLREFLSGEYTGSIKSERDLSEFGTRFRSANAGFIGSPNYVIIAEDRFLNPGTDSIAFLGMSRS